MQFYKHFGPIQSRLLYEFFKSHAAILPFQNIEEMVFPNLPSSIGKDL